MSRREPRSSRLALVALLVAWLAATLWLVAVAGTTAIPIVVIAAPLLLLVCFSGARRR
jgi:hypothetical protein